MRQFFCLATKQIPLLYTVENPYFIDKHHVKQDVLNYRTEAVHKLFKSNVMN